MKQLDHLKRCKQWDAYKQKRNYTTNLIKRKKKMHISKLFDDSQGKQTKHLWSKLRNVDTSNTILSSLGNTQPQPNLDITNALNHHFSNISQIMESHDSHLDTLTYSSTHDHKLENLPLIDFSQLILYLQEVKPNKATGSDGISVKLCNSLLHSLALFSETSLAQFKRDPSFRSGNKPLSLNFTMEAIKKTYLIISLYQYSLSFPNSVKNIS